MRIRYPHKQNADLDREDGDGNVILGAWREDLVLQEMNEVNATALTRAGKQQRVYLKHYYLSPLASVYWQDRLFPIGGAQ